MIEYILVPWTECLCFSIHIVVQSLSHVQLFATPWTAAHQASLSFTISWNLFKFMSIGSVMSSNQSCPLSSASPPPFSISQHHRHGTVCSGHDMGAAWMSISRLMDERAVVHIHSGVLLSHWKEGIWISSNEVDETGAHYTEWSKSERKTPIQCTNANIWNLERWQQWLYMWDSKRDTDVKNSLLDSGREGERGMICENSIETCVLPYVKQITSPGSMHETGFSGLVRWDDPEGWDGEGGSGWGTHVHL